MRLVVLLSSVLLVLKVVSVALIFLLLIPRVTCPTFVLNRCAAQSLVGCLIVCVPMSVLSLVRNFIDGCGSTVLLFLFLVLK